MHGENIVQSSKIDEEKINIHITNTYLLLLGLLFNIIIFIKEIEDLVYRLYLN